MTDDPLGAFCVANPVALTGAATGPLRGRTFAAKDVFEIAGTPTGFGHPAWLRTHQPAAHTASAVQKLLDAGADLVGRTISDELCYSLSGENVHFGTPRNAAAPDRIPGGSSAGSAAAVAGGLCDIAIGTDCGGSVRIPASYCGIYGIRPTHGRVATDGVLPFAGSFDVVGWFARDPALLASVGSLLLDSCWWHRHCLSVRNPPSATRFAQPFLGWPHISWKPSKCETSLPTWMAGASSSKLFRRSRSGRISVPG
jgi:amidase